MSKYEAIGGIAVARGYLNYDQLQECLQRQKDLKIVYLFSFIPKDGEPLPQVSPVQVEVAAQLDMTEATIDK